MNLGALLVRLQQIQNQAAVWEELVVYLRKAEDGEIEIPVDLDDGKVPTEEIAAVRAVVEQKWQSLLEKLEAAEEVEVPGVELDDDADLG